MHNIREHLPVPKDEFLENFQMAVTPPLVLENNSGKTLRFIFLVNNFYRTQVNLGTDLSVRLSLSLRPFVDLTYVTLADEDTNSILTDNANRQFKAMWQCKLRNLVANFANNATMQLINL